jgi:hypothetical protein
MQYPFRRLSVLALSALTLTACDGDSPVDSELAFLEGTREEPEIGVVVRSTGKALTLFQVGEPTETRQVVFGASESITPMGFEIRGERALVPLGNAASVALVDLETQRVERFFRFPSGNATGAAWVDGTTALVSNIKENSVGRFTLGQESDEIEQTVEGPAGDILVTGDRALVISANYDFDAPYPEGFNPGTVTAIDVETLEILDTVTVGLNSQTGAIGPDGLLYVVNTGDYKSPGSLSVLDPETLEVLDTYEGFGVGPGSIFIDEQGLAYIAGFYFGTLVWDTQARAFVRGPENPVCAPVLNAESGQEECRGAFDNDVDEEGNLYQVFFGSARKELKPWVFKYRPGTFELVDSIAVGAGPTAIDIRDF